MNPNVPSTATTSKGGGGLRHANSANTSPATPASEAARDQCRVHAPRYRELSPNRDHGNIEIRTTRANPATATRSPVAGTASEGGVTLGASSRMAPRHSGPIRVPRTGIAQAEQTDRPQRSHVPTMATPGWLAHRPGRAEAGATTGSGTGQAYSVTRGSERERATRWELGSETGNPRAKATGNPLARVSAPVTRKEMGTGSASGWGRS